MVTWCEYYWQFILCFQKSYFLWSLSHSSSTISHYLGSSQFINLFLHHLQFISNGLTGGLWFSEGSTKLPSWCCLSSSLSPASSLPGTLSLGWDKSRTSSLWTCVFPSNKQATYWVSSLLCLCLLQ